jgi:bloom syndrome protein
MCLTATANQSVVKDCIKIIQISNPYLHTQSFDRSNLFYSVKKKNKNLIDDIAQYISSRQQLTGIIYCLSKKDTETVANNLILALPAMKKQITFYHADVDAVQKEERQRKWSKGDIKVIWFLFFFKFYF